MKLPERTNVVSELLPRLTLSQEMFLELNDVLTPGLQDCRQPRALSADDVEDDLELTCVVRSELISIREVD